MRTQSERSLQLLASEVETIPVISIVPRWSRPVPSRVPLPVEPSTPGTIVGQDGGGGT